MTFIHSMNKSPLKKNLWHSHSFMKILPLIVKRAILVMAPFVFLISCEKPTESLGFEQVIGSNVKADTLHIPVQTYTADVDSILVALTYNNQLRLGGYASTRIFGQYSNGIFGDAKAELLSELLPRQVNPDFGNNPVVDSVTMHLRLLDAYGDTTVPMDIEVYELADGFSKDSIFYSDYNPAEKRLLGSLSGYIPKPNTVVKSEDFIPAPHLSIPLDVSYFQSQFADVGDGNFEAFSTFDKFLEYFKGIKVKTTAGGAVLYSLLNSNYSDVRIYFHNDEDTSVVELNFDADRSVAPINFSTFSQDYSSAVFNLATQDTVKGEKRTYVQAMGGVTTAIKIDPSRIDSLTAEGLIINQALLKLSTAVGTGDPAAPAARMEIRDLEGKHLGARVLDFQGTSNTTGNLQLGQLRENSYTFDLTRHLFDVLNTGENNTLAVVPVNRSTAASRTVMQGGNTAHEKAKIIVYYTKP